MIPLGDPLEVSVHEKETLERYYLSPFTPHPTHGENTLAWHSARMTEGMKHLLLQVGNVVYKDTEYANGHDDEEHAHVPVPQGNAVIIATACYILHNLMRMIHNPSQQAGSHHSKTSNGHSAETSNTTLT